AERVRTQRTAVLLLRPGRSRAARGGRIPRRGARHLRLRLPAPRRQIPQLGADDLGAPQALPLGEEEKSRGQSPAPVQIVCTRGELAGECVRGQVGGQSCCAEARPPILAPTALFLYPHSYGTRSTPRIYPSG